MITKETSKRASKILAAQKKEYARSFESAKGDSNAIAKAAADYRAEYGRTPQKRWAKALSQAAKETAVSKKLTKKTAAPTTKSKSAVPVKMPKYRVPCYVILTHFWKSLPFEQQAPHVVCFNEYEVKDGKVLYKAVITHPNGGKLTKQTIEERELSNSLVANERIMISSFENTQREIAYRKYQKECVDAEKKKHDADVAKRKAAQKASREAAKAKKPKATWRVGTHIQSPTDGAIYKIVAADVMPLKTPYIRYQLSEFLGSRRPTLDDKPEVIKSWRHVAPKEVNKLWKKHLTQKRYEEQASARAKQVEEEKKRKAEFKAIVKKNPDWIKDFAKQTGLPTKAIEALYRVCAKDEIRPILNGIYIGENNELVATDAHSLACVTAKKIPSGWKGKIFAPSGKTIESGKYPNYEAVLVNKGKVHVWVGHAKVERIYKEIPNKPSAEFKNIRGMVCIDLGALRLVSEQYKGVMKVFESINETPQCLQTGEETTAVGFVSRYARAVIMPVLKD